MKRFFLPILASLVVFLGFTSIVQAQPLTNVSSIMLAVELQKDAMAQLKEKMLPQIQNILTAEQEDQLETAMSSGKISMRKAFKSLALTPAQKTQLATVFKTLPKKELFSSMTPEQKREFFMKKKELFIPTPEEIAEYKAKKGE
jgi:Spy/CpxP family protein refolding chaperone